MTETKQFYGYKVETDPSNLPLTLDEVEAHLRITANSEDAYLTSLIEAVRDYFECYTNRTLINTTYKAFLDAFSGYYNNCCYDGILIRKSKVSSITSIEYLSDTVLTTWSADNYYFTDVNSYPSVYLVDGSTYPTDVDVRKQAIEIIFIAGMGATEASIPSDIKSALLNHIALLYENRGDCVADGTCQLSCMTKSIYNKYKIQPIGWGGC